MQSGLTAAQEAKLKAFVEANIGNVTRDDIAMFAQEFMTPSNIVQSFADYFAKAVEPAKPVKAARKVKQTGAAEAAPAASEPAGAEQGGSEDDSEDGSEEGANTDDSDDSLEPKLFD